MVGPSAWASSLALCAAPIVVPDTPRLPAQAAPPQSGCERARRGVDDGKPGCVAFGTGDRPLCRCCLKTDPWCRLDLDPLGDCVGVITVECRAEIRLHLSEGMSIKAITRRLGVARNTVRSALAARRLLN